MIPRFYQNLNNYIKPDKALIIYGARQVGKTTLIKKFLAETKLKYRLDSGDNISVQHILGSSDFSKILDYAKGYELIVIDEAQKIPDIGMGLKIIVDNVPGIKVIATGSSSFELAGQIGEPLTGRKRTLTLFPISQLELLEEFNKYDLLNQLPENLVYGTYPEIVSAENKEEKISLLNEIMNSYLLKDILELDKIRNSKTLLKLLRLLAFQVGNEVSLTELSQKVGLDYKTVARYIDILEKSFILFSLQGFSRNLRKEITRKFKYYFFDNGIRNAIISNFNDLEIRNDIGSLWENFLVSERLKFQNYKCLYSNNYFWRTYDQKEIDWIEERDGNLFAYEFTFSKSKTKKIPKDFINTYPDTEFNVINRENYLEFVAFQAH